MIVHNRSHRNWCRPAAAFVVAALAAICLQSPALNADMTSASGGTVPLQNAGPLSDDAIDRVGERVMNGHDFRSTRRRVLERMPGAGGDVVDDVDKGFLLGALDWMGDRIGDFFGAIGDFFQWLFSGLSSPGSPGSPSAPAANPVSNSGAGPMGLTDLLKLLAIGAIVAILIVIIAMIVKSVDARNRHRRSNSGGTDEILSDLLVPPGEFAASTYESRAIQLAADGNFRGAIRELLLGSMSWIERAGLIRYRKGLTNRDYVRAIWRRTEKRNAYVTTATHFEFVFFGRRVPTAEMFEMCLTDFRGAFREEEEATAAV